MWSQHKELRGGERDIHYFFPTACYPAQANKGRPLGVFVVVGVFFKNFGDSDVISVFYLSWDLRGGAVSSGRDPGAQE